MTTTYRTKLFKSILDCGCTLGLGEFSEEAEFADVEKWLHERGYELRQVERFAMHQNRTANPSERDLREGVAKLATLSA